MTNDSTSAAFRASCVGKWFIETDKDVRLYCEAVDDYGPRMSYRPGETPAVCPQWVDFCLHFKEVLPQAHDLTPSEVALAKMLAAWEEWPGQCTNKAAEMLCHVGQSLVEDGLWQAGGPTKTGRALLDRARKAGAL